MAGVLAPSGLPSSSSLLAPFRSRPYHQYSSPYSTTCLSTNDATPILCQDSQKYLDNRNSEPAAELTVKPARVSPVAIQADDLGISECINEKLDGAEQYRLLSTNKHGQSAQSYTSSNLKGKAVATGNDTVPIGRNVMAAERGSLNNPIMILNTEHETGNSQKRQSENKIRSLRKLPAHFRYPPGFLQPEVLDARGGAKKNTSDIAATAGSKLSYDRDSSDGDFLYSVGDTVHCQLDSIALGPSISELLDIDSFELDPRWDATSTDSQEQFCVREPVVVRPFQEVRAMTAQIELEGVDALEWEALNDGDDSGDKGAPTPCSASVAMVAVSSPAQLPDIMPTQVLESQYPKSQVGLDMDGDASTPMDVEPSNSIKGMLTLEGTHVKEVRSVLPRRQDDQEHEINDIIGKEEVNGEVYYWVDWTPTLMHLSELGKASDLVGKFETGLPAHRRHTKGQRKQLKSDRGRQAVAKAAFAPEKPPRLLQLLAAMEQAQHGIPAMIQKPRRGRPRKQK